jgi:hypothetical protein
MAKGMIRIKRIGVLSLGKIFGILYALMGLIFGAIITLVSLFAAVAFSKYQAMGLGGLFFGIGSVIVLPIFYGVMGCVSGVITAFLYNLVASWVGGVEVEVG